MEKLAAIETLIAPTLEAMGYALVRVRFSGGGRPTLQVMAERIDGAAMAVEDCAEISRTLSALLDVEDPLPGAYLLEVSSPGLDRPLVKPADYERFAGETAQVETARPVDGRKRFRGRLGGLVEGGVRLLLDEGEVVVPFAAIQRAKLLVTDEILAAAKRRNDKS
ncbi:MAG: ribosome maturation factor RimP [Dongiaceae bacterium]